MTFRISGRIVEGRTAVVTSGSSYSAAADDRYVVVQKDAGGPTQVNGPASPRAGHRIVVEDGRGDAAENPITFVPASGTVDGAQGKVIDSAFGGFEFLYTGSGWVTVGSSVSSPESTANRGQPGGYAGLDGSGKVADSLLTSNVPLKNAANSFSARQTFSGGVTIAPGQAPASPADGDLWVTSSGVYVRVNGSTVGPLGQTGGVVAADSDAAGILSYIRI